MMKTESFKKQINFKLRPDLFERLTQVANETGRTKTKTVELALAAFLAKKVEVKP